MMAMRESMLRSTVYGLRSTVRRTQSGPKTEDRRPKTYYYVRYVFDRSRQESAGVRPEGPEGRDPSSVGLRRPARDPVLLPERRHARMHEGDVRLSSAAAEAEADEGRGARHEHPGREEQGEVRQQARHHVSAA